MHSCGCARQIGKPTAHTLIDHFVDVFESFTALPVGVGDISPTAPTIQQHHFAASLECHAHDLGRVVALHGEYEISLAQHGSAELACQVCATVHTVLAKNLPGRRIHGLSDKRTQARAFDARAGGQVMSEQIFRRRTTTDVPYADNQNPFEHNAQDSRKPYPPPPSTAHFCARLSASDPCHEHALFLSSGSNHPANLSLRSA